MRCWSDHAEACRASNAGAEEGRGNSLSPALDRDQPSHKEKTMKNRRVWAAVLTSAAMTGASIAAAGNFASAAHSDFYSAGRHQFYVWCGGPHDHMAIEAGRDAEDAQLRLYQEAKAAGQTACWPVWQGRVAG
jgi:hypothetical protein